MPKRWKAAWRLVPKASPMACQVTLLLRAAATSRARISSVRDWSERAAAREWVTSPPGASGSSAAASSAATRELTFRRRFTSSSVVTSSVDMCKD